MASSLITSRQIEVEKTAGVTDLLFLGSKTSGWWLLSDYKARRRLPLGRKAMTNLDDVLKSRDIALLTKVHIVKAMVFPTVTYDCESWTVKQAEHQRNDAFELWCWRRLLRVLWTARRTNQSVLRKSTLNTCWKDWRWSWSSSILATWCGQLTHWKSTWYWERLRAEEGIRGWDGWMASYSWKLYFWKLWFFSTSLAHLKPVGSGRVWAYICLYYVNCLVIFLKASVSAPRLKGHYSEMFWFSCAYSFVRTF